MLDLSEHWNEVRALFKHSFNSSFHYAIASVNEDGTPHITPIGSLILSEPGRGFYFERFPRQLPRNTAVNKRICVLAVNSSRWFWIKSLLRGRFSEPPAVRLHGIAGELREATAGEVERWQRRVKRARFTKGHALIWAKMTMVRDIEFTAIEPVQIGAMTRESWGGLKTETTD